MKKLRWLKFLIAFLIPVMGVTVCNQFIDNDSWYVLAEGREIVENGIYYTDQLSIHEGLDVTVQNYGFAVIYYLIYSVVGPVGVYIGMLLINVLLCYLIYKICMLLSDKNVNLSLIIMVLTDLLLARWFITTRAQMVSYCIMMLVIYLLELYIKRDKTKYLWWIPVLSLAQINLHASLWPMIPIVLVVYIIDSSKFKKLHLDGYKTKPLLVTLAGSVLVGFLNPYGFKMMTFILTSYGVPEANESIQELTAFRPLGGGFEILLYLSVVTVMMLYIFGKKQRIRMRWLILTFGFLALGINTVKGMSNLILVLLFPMAAVYKDMRITEKWRKWGWMAASWVGIMAICTIVATAVILIPDAIDGPSEEMIVMVDKLDENVGNLKKEDLKVYVGYDHGGFLEYRGYKSYIDPRMEVFIKTNNNKEDIFKEWYDLKHGKIKVDDFVKKYDFDYIVAMEHEVNLYNLESGEYELIYDSKDEKLGGKSENDEDEERNDVDDNKDLEDENDKSGIRLYKKIKI